MLWLIMLRKWFQFIQSCQSPQLLKKILTTYTCTYKPVVSFVLNCCPFLNLTGAFDIWPGVHQKWMTTCKKIMTYLLRLSLSLQSL